MRKYAYVSGKNDSEKLSFEVQQKLHSKCSKNFTALTASKSRNRYFPGVPEKYFCLQNHQNFVVR